MLGSVTFRSLMHSLARGTALKPTIGDSELLMQSETSEFEGTLLSLSS